MTSLDASLEPGERVLARTGLHPVALLGAMGFAAFALLVTALLLVNNELPVATELRIAFVGALVAASGFVRPLLRLRRTVFALTDRRLLVHAGAFRLETTALPLEAVKLAVERPRRFVHAATLVVTAGDRVRAWSNVANAPAFVAAARPSGGRRERRQGS